jgi:hypothetical protein
MEWIIQWKSTANMMMPPSQPNHSACFQDDFAQTKKSGTRAMNASEAALTVGNAKPNSSGPASEAAREIGHETLGALSSAMPRAASTFVTPTLLRRAATLCLVTVVAFIASGCGRGPVEPPPFVAFTQTIQFQLYVNGQINPSQGNYIIAINANTTPTTNVNAVSGENPGMPTANEGQGVPPTYTHWDQEFIYGSATSAATNGFLYNYKVLSGGAGTTTVKFFPIILNTNDFKLVTNGSFGTGSGNVLSITLPLTNVSIRGNPASANPPTITSPTVTQIYVNYITTDITGTPQDQLGPNGLGTVGYSVALPITANYACQLPNFSSVSGPSNPNLFIIGGQITVSFSGTAPAAAIVPCT